MASANSRSPLKESSELNDLLRKAQTEQKSRLVQGDYQGVVDLQPEIEKLQKQLEAALKADAAKAEAQRAAKTIPGMTDNVNQTKFVSDLYRAALKKAELQVQEFDNCKCTIRSKIDSVDARVKACDISAINRGVILTLAKEGAAYKAELAALQLAHDEVIRENSALLETLRATLSDLKTEQGLFADMASAQGKYETAHAANNLGTMNEMDALLKQIQSKNAPRRLHINKTVTSLSRKAEQYNIPLPTKATQEFPTVNSPARSSSSGAAGTASEAASPSPKPGPMEGERGGNSRWTDADPEARGRPPPLNPPSPLTAPQMSVWNCTVCQTCNPTTALSCSVCTLLQSEVTDSGKNRDNHHHGEEHDDDIAEDDDTASESSEDGSEARLPSTAAAEEGVASD